MISKNIVFGLPIQHTLPTVSQVIDRIRKNAFRVKLATVDLERAYRNFGTDPSDWPLTCIRHNQSYVDMAVPFGSRLSSLYMQKVALFLQRALQSKGIETVFYLDDGLIIANESQDAEANLNIVIATIRSLGLPLAFEKLQSPSHVCRFLGIIIDVQKKTIQIPIEKIEAFLKQIEEVSGKAHISKTQLQSIIGSINKTIY